MPKNLEVACQTACGALSNPKTRSTIIIIDALNQVRFDSQIY